MVAATVYKDVVYVGKGKVLRARVRQYLAGHDPRAMVRLLVEQEGTVVSREEILQKVWGYNVFPTTRTVDNFIVGFRKYFEPDPRVPRYFHSVRGVGYKFTA